MECAQFPAFSDARRFLPVIKFFTLGLPLKRFWLSSESSNLFCIFLIGAKSAVVFRYYDFPSLAAIENVRNNFLTVPKSRSGKTLYHSICDQESVAVNSVHNIWASHWLYLLDKGFYISKINKIDFLQIYGYSINVWKCCQAPQSPRISVYILSEFFMLCSFFSMKIQILLWRLGMIRRQLVLSVNGCAMFDPTRWNTFFMSSLSINLSGCGK